MDSLCRSGRMDSFILPILAKSLVDFPVAAKWRAADRNMLNQIPRSQVKNAEV